MISSGFGSQTEELEANIQSRVGEFMGLKKKLLTMMNSSLITIRDPARDLHAKQLKLEADLPVTLAIIGQIKTDSYSLSDVAKVATFYYLMESQISDVNKLELEYFAGGGTAEPLVDWTKILIVGGGLALGYVLLGRKN